MMKMHLYWMLAACSGSGAPAPDASVSPADTGPISVKTTSHPVQYLAARLLGEQGEAACILPVGEDPAHWSPTGALVAQLADADLIVANGAGYEAWMQTAMLPKDRLVDSSVGISLIEEDAGTHSHGAEGEHSHHRVNPHIWMDPRHFRQQARTVHAALVALRPQHESLLDERLAKLEVDLDALAVALDHALAPAQGRSIHANHGTFAYFGPRYGLQLTDLGIEADQAVDDGLSSRLEGALSGVETPMIWWEAQPGPEVVAAFPADARMVVLDPLEQPASDGHYDYLVQAQANVVTLAASFAAGAADRGDKGPRRERQ